MKYDGYQVGIVIKSLRIQRKLTKEIHSEETVAKRDDQRTGKSRKIIL